VELIQFRINSIASKLLRKHENTVTMLPIVVAVADEDAWCALIFTAVEAIQATSVEETD
jgi:hypothetical protein